MGPLEGQLDVSGSVQLARLALEPHLAVVCFYDFLVRRASPTRVRRIPARSRRDGRVQREEQPLLASGNADPGVLDDDECRVVVLADINGDQFIPLPNFDRIVMKFP